MKVKKNENKNNAPDSGLTKENNNMKINISV